MSTKQRSIAIVIFHALLVSASLVTAWLLRFEFHLPAAHLLFSVMPILIFYRLAAMGRFSLLHGYWSHTGVHDVLEMTKANALGSAAFILTVRYFLALNAFPISIYILEAVITSVMVLGVRVISRLTGQRAKPAQRTGDRRRRQRIFIAGAGFTAQLLIQELAHEDRWQVVGCLDDDPRKIGAKIHGVPVLGTLQDLPALSAEHRAFEVLIAIPSATAVQMQRIVQICDQVGVKYKTVPSLRDFVAGQSSVHQLREVNVEDLLGRDPVILDLEPVRRKLRGNTVMVTGAAGSIGSELVKQILRYEPAVLLCVDQDETGLFDLQQSLGVPPDTRVEFCLADVMDRKRMRSIFLANSVDAVFHAAAYKHVSMTESNVCEVLENNVFGLLTMLDVSEASGCNSFVLISSDKAVNPSSFMGCTKRIGELILASRPAATMRCVTVRFGNVLGSQGSVVPLFQQQIRMKRQITVTHPDVTRYFMTIPEAVTLVLQAFVIGKHGDLLVLDMGKPVRIVDLARTLIKLSGMREGDVKVEFTGLRQGEKLHEELFYDHEEQLSTTIAKITLAKGQTGDWDGLSRQLDDLLIMSTQQTHTSIRRQVKQIVPEYEYERQAPNMVRRDVRSYMGENRAIDKQPVLVNTQWYPACHDSPVSTPRLLSHSLNDADGGHRAATLASEVVDRRF
jgi:FlaA1/EpsC-like NDP-sugar epimerase